MQFEFSSNWSFDAHPGPPAIIRHLVDSNIVIRFKAEDPISPQTHKQTKISAFQEFRVSTLRDFSFHSRACVFCFGTKNSTIRVERWTKTERR